jgi:hypothetical protein
MFSGESLTKGSASLYFMSLRGRLDPAQASVGNDANRHFVTTVHKHGHCCAVGNVPFKRSRRARASSVNCSAAREITLNRVLFLMALHP